MTSVLATVPPLQVGAENKDTTQNEHDVGDDEFHDDDERVVVNNSKQQESENDDKNDVDLEEGEIVDSDEDGNDAIVVKEDKTSSVNVQESGAAAAAANKACSPGFDAEDSLLKKRKRKRKKKQKRGLNDEGGDAADNDEDAAAQKPKKKVPKYIDHDKVDDDDMWLFNCESSPNLKRQRGFGDPMFDGGLYDTPEYSPEYRRSQWDSPSAYSDDSGEEMDEAEEKPRKMPAGRGGRKKPNDKMGKKKRKGAGPGGGPDAKKARMAGGRGARGKKKEGKQKTKAVCKFFLEGKCNKGSDCPFSHRLKPPKKKKLCKFYLNGYCARGEECLYMHGEFPCKFFHTGAKCYSDENCRFSHDPLTPEMKKLLDDYLEKDDSLERNGDSGPEDLNGSTPSSSAKKRPSLLGSPPRHMRQAVETWKWQQEILQMEQQHEGKGKSLFHIDRSMVASPPGPESPTHNDETAKPIANFYVETLKDSPVKEPPPLMIACSPPHPLPPPMMMQPKLLNDDPANYYSDPEMHMSMPPPPRPHMPPPDLLPEAGLGFQPLVCDLDLPKEDVDLRIPLKADIADPVPYLDVPPVSDETYEDDPPESAASPPESSSPHSHHNSSLREDDVEENSNSQSQLSPERSQSPPASISPPPISIPSHLPRKQRELYLRIQHNQKEAANRARQMEEEMKKKEQSVEDKASAGKKEAEEQWYSSDEDDDTLDQPLTNVLKKLQQAPPAPQQPQQVPAEPDPSTSTSSSSQPSSNPDESLGLLLSAIQRQVSKRTPDPSLTDNLWESILSNVKQAKAAAAAAAAAESSKPSLLSSPVQQQPVATRDPRLRNTAAATSTPLPSSSLPLPSLLVDQGSPQQVNIAKRDPRLQGRMSKMANPKDATKPAATTVMPPHQDKLWETPAMDKSNGCVISSNGNNGGGIKYKLHAVSTSHPNYAPYLLSSQSNPNLLNDPRIKKKLSNAQQGASNTPPPVSEPAVSAVPLQLPNLPLNIPKPASETVINSPGQNFPHQQVANKEQTASQQLDQPNRPTKAADPRLAKLVSSDPRLARVQSASSSPPSSAASEKDPRVSPAHHPSLPAIISSNPRAASDPRLSRHSADEHRSSLHRKPKRQGQTTQHLPSNSANKQGSSQSQQQETGTQKKERVDPRLTKHSQANENATESEGSSSSSNNKSAGGKENATQSVVQNKESKTVQKPPVSRKSTMDYSSPLSSYEDSNSSSSYGGGYNRRPARNPPALKQASQASANIPQQQQQQQMPQLVDSRQELVAPPPMMPPFMMPADPPPLLMDHHQSEQAPSLKDMFKTIDPTASPFC